MVCTRTVEGCTSWSTGIELQCPTSQTCVVSGTTANCTTPAPPTPCTNPCTTIGSTKCNGYTGIQTCNYNSSSKCNSWSDPVICPTGKICDSTTNPVSCKTTPNPCSNQCTSGEKKCSTDLTTIINCIKNTTTGCTIWGNNTACPTGQTCVASGTTANCTSNTHPPDECNLGEKKCSSDLTTVMNCIKYSDGGTAWVVNEKCPADLKCFASGTTARCASYKNQCTLGKKKCSEDLSSVMNCVKDASGFTVWRSYASGKCPTGQYCNTTNIVACSSQKMCNLGEKMCSAGFIENCVYDSAQKINLWRTYKVCPNNTDCNLNNGTFSCIPSFDESVGECKLGDMICNNTLSNNPNQSDGFNICLENPYGDGKKRFAYETCPGNEICDASSGKASCTTPYSTPGNYYTVCKLGDKVCFEGSIETCVRDSSKDTNTWKVTKTCATGQICDRTKKPVACVTVPPNPSTCKIGSKICSEIISYPGGLFERKDWIEVCKSDNKGGSNWSTVEKCDSTKVCSLLRGSPACVKLNS